MSVTLRALDANDRTWVRQFISEHWGADTVVAHGTLYRPDALPGVVAQREGQRIGLVTYHIKGQQCEIVTLDSLQPSRGVGTALIQAVEQIARRSGCTRLWLITTNDNLNALRFYQKRGFVLAALHPNALEASRQLKPEIPLIGNDGIPLRDELEFEKRLEQAA